MQNHSSYAQGWNNLEKTITHPDVQRAADTTAEQYLSLIRASDDALRDLIEHYSQSEEPTMVVFFGDHQPPLKNAFYEQLYGKKLSERTTEEVMQQYAHPLLHLDQLRHRGAAGRWSSAPISWGCSPHRWPVCPSPGT